jgi:hypothetical protein
MTIICSCAIDDYLKNNAVADFNRGDKKEDGFHYEPKASYKADAIKSEILASMINSSRVFAIEGKDNEDILHNLELHVNSRLAIIAFAKAKKYDFALNDIAPQEQWKADQTVVTDAFTALNDVNSNSSAYTLGCLTATRLTMLGGIVNALGKEKSNKVLGSNPMGNRRLVIRRSKQVANEDWIPGDWGYIENTAPQSEVKRGRAGENIVYLGGNKFWGHVSKDLTIRSLAEWVAEVREWNKKDPKVENVRDEPSVGLKP